MTCEGFRGVLAFCSCRAVGAQTAPQAPRPPPLHGPNRPRQPISQRRGPWVASLGGSGRRPSLRDGPRPSWMRARMADSPLRCSGRGSTVRATERPKEKLRAFAIHAQGVAQRPLARASGRRNAEKRPAIARRHKARCPRVEARPFRSRFVPGEPGQARKGGAV